MYARLCIIFYLFYMPVCLSLHLALRLQQSLLNQPIRCNKMYFSTKTGKRTLYRTCQFTTRSSYAILS